MPQRARLPRGRATNRKQNCDLTNPCKPLGRLAQTVPRQAKRSARGAWRGISQVQLSSLLRPHPARAGRRESLRARLSCLLHRNPGQKLWRRSFGEPLSFLLYRYLVWPAWRKIFRSRLSCLPDLFLPRHTAARHRRAVPHERLARRMALLRSSLFLQPVNLEQAPRKDGKRFAESQKIRPIDSAKGQVGR